MARQPFFNTNYQVASTAPAANLIARSGAVQGQMFANLGKIGADALDKFRKNKEEKEEQEEYVKMGKMLPLETFAPFGVQTEEERSAWLDGTKKSEDARRTAVFMATLGEQAKQKEGQRQFREAMLPSAPAEVPQSDSPIRDFFAREKAQDEAQGLGSIRDPNRFLDAVRQANLSPEAQERAMNRFMALQDRQSNLQDEESLIRTRAQYAPGPSPLEVIKFQQDSLGFNQDQDFKTFKPENNFIQVGTETLPVTGTIGSVKVAEELKNDIPNFNAMNGMFSRLMELGEEEDFWDESEKKIEANALVKSIQGQMREEVLGPGTVTDSERAILDDIVANPFKKGDNINAEEAMKMLRKLQTQLSDKFKNKLTSYGLNVGGASTAQPSTPSLTTSSGKKVQLINLDNL